jgi:hypothetical protein
MDSPADEIAFAAAWSTWKDRSAAPPAGLLEVLERLRDGADRAVSEAPFGAARAEAIAWQLHLAAAARILREPPAREPRLGDWKTLAVLAKAASGDARAELLALTIEAGGGEGKVIPACLEAIAPLLHPAKERAWALAGLANEALDASDQGTLIGLLPEDDVAALLPPRLEKAAAIADFDERWSALHGLVAEVPERWEERARELSFRLHGKEGRESYWAPIDPLDEAQEKARAELERERWGAPLTAWRLGEAAEAAPAGERGPILDRAIEAFAEIALTPVSPGNDEGPFWAMAQLLDEPRVRRALAVVDRMEAASWESDRCAARASLLGRLAWLGHADEAERLIPRIGAEARLASHWRANAWGRVIAARMAQDPALRFEALFARSEGDPDHHAEQWRWDLLAALLLALHERSPPDVENVEALIDLARSFEPKKREVALEDLMQTFFAVLPAERWLSVVLAACAGQERVDALVILAELLGAADRDPTPALRPLLAQLAASPSLDPRWTMRDLAGFRAWIAPEDALATWSQMIRRANGVHYELRDELPEILVWLAGPEAPLAVGRAIARAAALPAQPPERGMMIQEGGSQ